MALPTKEQELLALALHIERTEGANGPRYIAERIGSAVMQHNAVEIDFWKGVARQYESLIQTDKRTDH